MVNMTKIKIKKDRLEKVGKRLTVFSEWGHSFLRQMKDIKVKNWNGSRYRLGSPLVTEAQCSGFFLWGQWQLWVFLTSHLSKLPWVKTQGLNHTHCDSASSTGCKNIMTSPVRLQEMDCVSHLLLLKRCLVLQQDIKPKRLGLRVMSHWSTCVLRCNKSWE